jgi:hypothetical protein
MNRPLPPGDRGNRSSDPGRPSRRGRPVPGTGGLVDGVKADQGRDGALVIRAHWKDEAHDGR